MTNEGNEIPAAYPFIQPMKAAFHFDSVEGFGEWRILISTRADRNLRESKKKNPKLFAIILKKIKYVSCCLNQVIEILPDPLPSDFCARGRGDEVH